MSARSTPIAVWPPTWTSSDRFLASRSGTMSSRSRCTSCGRALVLRRPLGHDLEQHAAAVRARDRRAHLLDVRVLRRSTSPSWLIAATSSGLPDVAREQQRAVESGPETLAQQVVGAAGRELRRIVAGVGDAEAQRDERQREDDQDRATTRSRRATAGPGSCGSTGPRSSARACASSGALGSANLSIV